MSWKARKFIGVQEMESSGDGEFVSSGGGAYRRRQFVSLGVRELGSSYRRLGVREFWSL